MEVYAAFNSVPDFNSGHPPFRGVATTLDGAIKLIFPNGDAEFKPGPREGTWNGPDGYGRVERITLHD